MKYLFYLCRKKRTGMAALFVVIIIGAAALIMTLSSSFLGIGELESAYVGEKGNEALSLSEACAEEALRRLRMDDAFSSSSLNFDNGSCTITVTTDGFDRTIDVLGVVDNYYRRIEVSSTISGTTVTVNGWQEKDN